MISRVENPFKREFPPKVLGARHARHRRPDHGGHCGRKGRTALGDCAGRLWGIPTLYVRVFAAKRDSIRESRFDFTQVRSLTCRID